MKTTLIGLLLAIVIGIEPILSGSGYHLDAPTVTKIVAAVLIALKGYYSQDEAKK